MAITSSRLPVAAASRISGVDHEAPDRQDHRDRDDRQTDGAHQRAGDRHAIAAEQADDDDDGHDHEVLEEQHADAQPPDRRGEAARLDQHLRGDGRRRQGQRHADDQRHREPPTIQAAVTPMTSIDRKTCTEPMPSTVRRIAHSRSSENSSPIRKSRKMTPSSAKAAPSRDRRR